MNDNQNNNPMGPNSLIPPGRTSTGFGGSENSQNSSRSINFLLDIPLELTVEVGRRMMTMGELIDLLPGTIVELDRPAGEQLDILANGKLVARGEAVVVGDRYGIRILEVVGDEFAAPTASRDGGT